MCYIMGQSIVLFYISWAGQRSYVLGLHGVQSQGAVMVHLETGSTKKDTSGMGRHDSCTKDTRLAQGFPYHKAIRSHLRRPHFQAPIMTHRPS